MPRFYKLFTLLFALMGLMFAASASAETASPKQLQVNVILFYPAKSAPNHMSPGVMIYQSPGTKGPGFYATASTAYGGLRIQHKLIYLELRSGERVVSGTASYVQSKTGTQITERWLGKTPLPRRVRFNGRWLPLTYVSVSIHSRFLPNQQPVGPPPPAPAPQVSCQPSQPSPSTTGGAGLDTAVSLSTPDGLQQWESWLNAQLQLYANGQPSNPPFSVLLDDGSTLACTVS